MDLDRALSFCYSAVVGHDNCVRLGSHVLDTRPGPRGCGYAKAEVEVGQLLDGCRRIYQGEKLLGEYPPTEVVDPLRRPKRNPNAPGADDAQWIYLASAPPEEPKTVGRATRSPGRGIRASRVA